MDGGAGSKTRQRRPLSVLHQAQGHNSPSVSICPQHTSSGGETEVQRLRSKLASVRKSSRDQIEQVSLSSFSVFQCGTFRRMPLTIRGLLSFFAGISLFVASQLKQEVAALQKARGSYEVEHMLRREKETVAKKSREVVNLRERISTLTRELEACKKQGVRLGLSPFLLLLVLQGCGFCPTGGGGESLMSDGGHALPQKLQLQGLGGMRAARQSML